MTFINITVPTGKCPLDVIAEIGDLKGAQICLADDVLQALKASVDWKTHSIKKNCCVCYEFEIYIWKASENRPATTIEVTNHSCKEGWNRVLRIEGIVHTVEPYSPNRYINIKMA